MGKVIWKKFQFSLALVRLFLRNNDRIPECISGSKCKLTPDGLENQFEHDGNEHAIFEILPERPKGGGGGTFLDAFVRCCF